METSRNLFSSQTVKPLEGSPAIPWLLTGCVKAMGKEEMTRKFQNYENHVLQRDGTVFQGNEFEGKVAICELDRRGRICDLAIKDNCSDNEETYFDHDDEFVGGSNHSDSDATYCSIVVPEETIMKSQEEMGLSEVEEEGSSNTWKSPSLLCNFANKFNGEDEDLENFKQSDRSETRVTSCDGMSNDVHITKAQDDTSALPDCVKNSNGLQSKERSHMGLKEGSFDLDGSSCAIVQTNSETERDQGSASMLPLPSFSMISGRGDLHWQNSELDCMTMTTSECSELLPQLMNTNPFGDKSSGCELLHLSPDPFSDLLSKLPHIELGEGWNVDKSVVDSVCDTSDRSRISPRKKENILHSDLSKPSSNSLVVGFETPLLEPETNDFGFTPCQMEETNTIPDGNHSTVLYPSEVYSQAIEGQNIIPHNAGMLSSNAQHQEPTSVVCNQLSTSQVSPKFTAQTPSKILEEVPSKSTFFLPLSGSTPSPLQLEVSFDLATQVNSPIISQDAISKAIEMISTPGCQNGISYLLKDINLLGDDGKENCGDALGSIEALSRPQDHMDKQVEKGVTLPVLQSKVPNNQNSNEFVSVDVNSATSEFTSASTRGNFFHPEKWDADKENIQSENVDYSNLDSNDIRHGANISTSHYIGQSVIGRIDNVSSKSLWTDIPGLLQEGNSQGLPKVIHSSNILQGQDMTSAVGPVSGCSPRKKRQNRDRQTHGYVKSHKKYGLPPMTTFGSAVARMVQRLQKISTDIYRQVLKRRDLKAIQEELRTASSVIYRLHNGMVSMNKTKAWTRLEEVKQVCEKLTIKVGQLLRQCKGKRRGDVNKDTSERIALGHQYDVSLGSKSDEKLKTKVSRRGRKKKNHVNVFHHSAMMLPMGTDLETQEMELDEDPASEKLAMAEDIQGMETESPKIGYQGPQEDMETEDLGCGDLSTTNMYLMAVEKVNMSGETKERETGTLSSGDQKFQDEEKEEEEEMKTKEIAHVDSNIGGFDVEHNSTQSTEPKNDSQEELVTGIESPCKCLRVETEGGIPQSETDAQEQLLEQEVSMESDYEIHDTIKKCTAETNIPYVKDSSKFNSTVEGLQDVACQVLPHDVLEPVVATVTSTSHWCLQPQSQGHHHADESFSYSCGFPDLQKNDTRAFDKAHSPKRSYHGEGSKDDRGMVPAKTLSLVRMLEAGLVESGEKQLTVQHKGKDFHASIMADGTLESSDGLFFTTPQAWLQALTKSYKKKEQAFKKVQYKGTTLYEIAARHARGDGPRGNEVRGTVGGGGGGGDGGGGLAGERNSREIEEKRKFGFRCVGRVSEEEMLILRRKSQGKSLQTLGDDGGVHPTSPGRSGGHDPVTGVTCFPKEFLGFCGSATRTRVDQNGSFGLGATEGGLYPHHPGCECDKSLGCGASGGVTGSGTMGRSLGFALGQNSASRSLEEREVSSHDVNLQTHSSFSPRLGFSRRTGLKVVAEPSSGNGSKNPGPPSSGPPEEKSRGHHHTGLPEARSRSHGSSGLPEGSFETLREDHERRPGQQPEDQSSSYPVPGSRHPVGGSPRHDVRSEASTVSSVAFWSQSLRAIKRLLFVIEVANRKANF